MSVYVQSPSPMLSILITLLTLFLILVCVVMVSAILMQRSSSDGGLGAAMGGGAAESAFGADAVNVLTRATKWSAIIFFSLAFGLYLLHMAAHRAAQPVDDTAPLQFEADPAAAEAAPSLDVVPPAAAPTTEPATPPAQ